MVENLLACLSYQNSNHGNASIADTRGTSTQITGVWNATRKNPSGQQSREYEQNAGRLKRPDKKRLDSKV